MVQSDDKKIETVLSALLLVFCQQFVLTAHFSCTSRSMMPKALDGQIVMEKTPRYFVTVETPARVHAMSQDVKLIVVVRDPVTRAISDYTQIISKTPDIPSFESLAFKNRTTGTILYQNDLFFFFTVNKQVKADTDIYCNSSANSKSQVQIYRQAVRDKAS